MHYIHATRALLPDGWATDVRIGIEEGRVATIQARIPAEPEDERCAAVIPGMPNLHSHAFQRGISGLTEVPGNSSDSFWTWRDVMYRFALMMSPPELEVIATQLYIEMLEAGFTRVGEFHYLHHDRDGSPYTNVAEMATRIAAAASRSGIALTLLPVFYAHAGFGGSPPTEGQRRFINDPERYHRLLVASGEAVQGLPNAVIGVAPHSLRAVTPRELTEVCAMLPDGPIHIHIAEQRREVDDCVAWSGARPVTWLLNEAEVDARWCLIHATHMTPDETDRLADSDAVAGLCPITEANLGDGIFPGARYIVHNGRFGIGTDANTLIGIPEELRQLEYSQRLARGGRNVMTRGEPTGRALFDAALRGGLQALGAPNDGIRAGAAADLVALDGPGSASDGDTMLGHWVFGQGVAVDRVWVAGRQVVREGRHIAHDEAESAFRVVMRTLMQVAKGHV